MTWEESQGPVRWDFQKGEQKAIQLQNHPEFSEAVSEGKPTVFVWETPILWDEYPLVI